MNPSRDQRLKVGSALLVLASLGLSAASVAIVVGDRPDVATRVGRHLWAGALANASLSILLALLAYFPLRRGERWAFWAYVVPFVGYGIPILALDALNVSSRNLVATLLPPLIGTGLMLIGLALAGSALFGKSGDSRPPDRGVRS